METSLTTLFEPNGRHCALAQRGLRPYRRCRYCDLSFRECFPTQFFVTVLGILGLLVVLFTVQDLPVLAWEIAAGIAGLMGILMLISRQELNQFVFSNMTLQTLNRQLEQRIADRTQQLNSANEKLQRADQLKSDFLSMVSHELRTPLTSILGYTDLLAAQNDGPHVVPERQKRFLEVIKRNSKTLLEMINNLLDVEKLEHGMIKMKWGSVDLVHVVHDAVDLMRPLSDGKSVALKSDLPADAIVVESDEEKVRHILVNLISNAIKFTPQGGHIDVALTNGGEQYTISVKDSGMGIDPRDRDRLFNKFVQLDQPDHPSVQGIHGTGLGLSLAKGFTEMLGGHIGVESEGKGKGTRFFFSIPKSKGSEAHAHTRR